MTYAAVTLLTLVAGQPAPDYYPMNSKNIRIPIEYKKDRKSIRRVELYVARGENTWYQESVVTPDRDEFVYFAKDDGIYWFKMVIVDLKGNKEPADLTTDPPDMKILVDTTRPVVRFTNARRNGQEVVVEWAVDDKFPNDAETKVSFRPTANPNDYWRDVKLPDGSKNGVRFPCGTNEAITVRVSAVDIAGNRSEATYDLSTANATAPPVTSMSPPAPPAPGGLISTPTHSGFTQPGNTGTPGPVAPPPPPDLGPPGSGGSTPPPGPPGMTQPIAPYQPTAGPPATPPATSPGVQPLPVVDPKAPPPPPPPAHVGATPAGGFTPPTSSPSVELTRAHVIKYPRFDLGFDLEKRGPSGISRVDLWVTRDDGKTWHMWSHHDGKDGVVRVVLDVPGNQLLEGVYGFRLVPVSGAGLSDREPVAGDAPDMRVVLDVTPPEITLFPPKADETAPDTLLLQWKATDKNFGNDPIVLEWSEAATGPWRPVVTGANEAILQTSGTTPPVAKRLANTGHYAWQVPSGIPPRVFLKVTAQDAAGNVREVVTRDPILVDLTKPRAKINGILPPPIPPRP